MYVDHPGYLSHARDHASDTAHTHGLSIVAKASHLARPAKAAKLRRLSREGQCPLSRLPFPNLSQLQLFTPSLKNCAPSQKADHSQKRYKTNAKKRNKKPSNPPRSPHHNNRQHRNPVARHRLKRHTSHAPSDWSASCSLPQVHARARRRCVRSASSRTNAAPIRLLIPLALHSRPGGIQRFCRRPQLAKVVDTRCDGLATRGKKGDADWLGYWRLARRMCRVA